MFVQLFLKVFEVYLEERSFYKCPLMANVTSVQYFLNLFLLHRANITMNENNLFPYKKSKLSGVPVNFFF